MDGPFAPVEARRKSDDLCLLPGFAAHLSCFAGKQRLVCGHHRLLAVPLSPVWSVSLSLSLRVPINLYLQIGLFLLIALTFSSSRSRANFPGPKSQEFAIEAARTRLRPILMTLDVVRFGSDSTLKSHVTTSAHPLLADGSRNSKVS